MTSIKTWNLTKGHSSYHMWKTLLRQERTLLSLPAHFRGLKISSKIEIEYKNFRIITNQLINLIIKKDPNLQ